jgi:nitrogen fixation/metabolism regulation signal transduction histidine kinase
MGSNRFFISVVLNCLFIFIAAFSCFYFLQIRQQPNTAVGIAFFAVLLTIRLIYYVNRTNRILGNFISYMQEHDPSLQFSVRYVKKHFKGLHESMQGLISDLKEHRINLEVQAHYLETILDNVSTGILCFDRQGSIQTMNRAAGTLLQMEHLDHVTELDVRYPGLGTRILHLQPNREITETVHFGANPIHLAILSSKIKLKQEPVHIVAINDISNQLEMQEILSWKKLIRVINHEIMNSMTPIITLSMAIRKKLARGDKGIPAEKLSEEALADAIESAWIIEERSSGLVAFIERYKKLTSLPPLKLERFSAKELFTKMDQFFREDLKARKIRIRWPGSCDTMLEADRQMLEQVMINLVKNSMEALQYREDPEIVLSCQRDSEDRICLTVGDNGEGIPGDKLDQAFVPFFTTREQGSGIGLSLCRQIIQSHGGSIRMESAPGKGTRVVIHLNLQN